MSDQPILFCPQCNHVCKTLRGLAQHTSHRPACRQKSLPILDGITCQNPAFHQSFVQLDAPHADEDMEHIWQQNDDPSAFEHPQGSPEEAHINVDSATLQSLYNHRNELDNHLSRQLADNGLVDSRTMLDTEDRQDIMLADTDESFGFQEDDAITEASTNVFDVDDEDISLQFTDRLRGQYTSEELMSLRLLKLLRAIGAPNYAYRSVMDIFADACSSKVVNSSSTFRQRDTAIRHFANRFRLHKLYPTTLTKHMNGRSYPVVLHEAEVMIQSLLKSSLMVEDNMLFPDMDNPLAPPPSSVETIADVDTGQVFRSAYGNLCTRPNDVLCPLIMYLDRICIDQHGRCSLEPGYATLGIWNVTTRNKAEAWRPLGYIPNLYLLSKNENKFRMNSLTKLRMYHEILDAMLASVVRLQSKGGIPFSFSYRGKQYNVNLKVFLMFIIGDTEGHDKLCGRYNSRALQVKRVCRHCDIPTMDCDNAFYPWKHVMPDAVHSLVASNDVEGLKAMSQHLLTNAFYNPKLDIGHNPRGIHGMTPGEPLHVVDLGLFKYGLEGFFICLGMNPKSKAPCKILMELDSMARRIGRFLSHQSDRQLPRTYFPFGVTGGTKLSGHEYQGVVLVVLIMCVMEESRLMFLSKISVTVLHQWIRLFELLLGWRYWLKKASIPRLEVEQSQLATQNLMMMFKTTVKRKHGNGSKFPKLHLPCHFSENMIDFGVIANVDSGPPESNHKPNAKAPSQHTQMRAESFEVQTAQRYVENLIIDFAADALQIDTNAVPKSAVVTPDLFRGARFVFEVSEGCEGDTNVVSFEWKSKSISEPYHQQYTDWLTRHVFSKLTPGTRVQGCTEHKRHDQYLFRAHPAYRGHNQWHDWATFDWSGSNTEESSEDRVCIPGQIVFFLEVTEEMVGIDVGGEMTIPSTGLFALIESLENPLPHPARRTELVVKGSKCLTTQQEKKRRLDGRSVRASNLFLVPVESIDQPISGIPNLGGRPGDFVFVRPVHTWSDCFSDYIAMCHGGMV